MTIKSTRVNLAKKIDNALAGIQIAAYRPKVARALNGWMELSQVDTEDTTFGECRCQFRVVILLGADQASFEKLYDDIAPALLTVLTDLGRGVTIQPFTEAADNATLFCVVGTITTESEAG